MHVSLGGQSASYFLRILFFFPASTSNIRICYSDLWLCVGVSSRRPFIVSIHYICVRCRLALIYRCSTGVQFVLANRILKKNYIIIYTFTSRSRRAVMAAAGDRCGSVKNMIYSTEFSLRALVLLLLTYIIFFDCIPVDKYIYIFLKRFTL